MRTSSTHDPDAGIMSVKDAVNINEMIMEIFRVYPKIIKRGGLCYIASNGTEFNVGYYKDRYEMYFCNDPYVLFQYDHVIRTIDMDNMEFVLDFCKEGTNPSSIVSRVAFPLVHADREGAKDWIE